jgi:hypothetical protein
MFNYYLVAAGLFVAAYASLRQLIDQGSGAYNQSHSICRLCYYYSRLPDKQKESSFSSSDKKFDVLGGTTSFSE